MEPYQKLCPVICSSIQAGCAGVWHCLSQSASSSVVVEVMFGSSLFRQFVMHNSITVQWLAGRMRTIAGVKYAIFVLALCTPLTVCLLFLSPMRSVVENVKVSAHTFLAETTAELVLNKDGLLSRSLAVCSTWHSPRTRTRVSTLQQFSFAHVMSTAIYPWDLSCTWIDTRWIDTRA